MLSVSYRGSTGFGKKFINAGDLEWARDMHNDLLDAVDWAVKEKIAQPDKVAIYGGSYGGYATLVGLTFTPDRFACGVDIVGPSNLPKPVVARLNRELTQILKDGAVRDMLAREGADSAPSTPEEFGRIIASDVVKWAKVVKSAGIKLE